MVMAGRAAETEAEAGEEEGRKTASLAGVRAEMAALAAGEAAAGWAEGAEEGMATAAEAADQEVSADSEAAEEAAVVVCQEQSCIFQHAVHCAVAQSRAKSNMHAAY